MLSLFSVIFLFLLQSILKKDQNNYYALVYLGAALLELGKTQQSLENYKKATQVDPKNILAWQGIIKFYEKQGIKCHSDLLDAYKVVATHYEKYGFGFTENHLILRYLSCVKILFTIYKSY